jgi:hypothetical protein
MKRNHFFMTQGLLLLFAFGVGALMFYLDPFAHGFSSAAHAAAGACILAGVIAWIIYDSKRQYTPENVLPAYKEALWGRLSACGAAALAFECAPIFASKLIVSGILMGCISFVPVLAGSSFLNAARAGFKLNVDESSKGNATVFSIAWQFYGACLIFGAAAVMGKPLLNLTLGDVLPAALFYACGLGGLLFWAVCSDYEAGIILTSATVTDLKRSA